MATRTWTRDALQLQIKEIRRADAEGTPSRPLGRYQYMVEHLNRADWQVGDRLAVVSDPATEIIVQVVRYDEAVGESVWYDEPAGEVTYGVVEIGTGREWVGRAEDFLPRLAGEGCEGPTWDQRVELLTQLGAYVDEYGRQDRYDRSLRARGALRCVRRETSPMRWSAWLTMPPAEIIDSALPPTSPVPKAEADPMVAPDGRIIRRILADDWHGPAAIVAGLTELIEQGPGASVTFWVVPKFWEADPSGSSRVPSAITVVRGMGHFYPHDPTRLPALPAQMDDLPTVIAEVANAVGEQRCNWNLWRQPAEDFFSWVRIVG